MQLICEPFIYEADLGDGDEQFYSYGLLASGASDRKILRKSGTYKEFSSTSCQVLLHDNITFHVTVP
jgi:hypothetical protein